MVKLKIPVEMLDFSPSFGLYHPSGDFRRRRKRSRFGVFSWAESLRLFIASLFYGSRGVPKIHSRITGSKPKDCPFADLRPGELGIEYVARD